MKTIVDKLRILKNSIGAKNVAVYVGSSERTIYRWSIEESELPDEKRAKIEQLYVQFLRSSESIGS
jgi:hypothetical protein